MTIPSLILPNHYQLYYGGAWHAPKQGRCFETRNPATNELLGQVAEATAEDADAAVAAAQDGFREWRRLAPLERARMLRAAANVIRQHAKDLAMLDAADSGNPITEMSSDAVAGAGLIEYFAGLVTEMKGSSIPMGPNAVNFTVREPRGVVARIIAFNHPVRFALGKIGAPLAAGNTVILKPPEQAPLSSLRLAELLDGQLPPGVFNVLQGREVGAVLSGHKGIAMVTLTGSVPTGRAIMRSASATLKPLLLELGGKNALIACADVDPDAAGTAIIEGMNFTWCGQSCGSTSRAFVHEAIYDKVIECIKEKIAFYKPGIPTNPATTAGAIISKAQYDRVLAYIQTGREEGARLLCGGGRPSDPELEKGWFIEPTIFVDVTQDMRIANEEIFGPVLSVLRWSDEQEMISQVNRVEYGLTCAIWTKDITRAHQLAQQVEAGYIWINEVSKHFLGAPFGGYKQSGIGREACLGELLSFTQEKNIHIRLNQ